MHTRRGSSCGVVSRLRIIGQRVGQGVAVALAAMCVAPAEESAQRGRDGEPTSYLCEHPLATVLANDVPRTIGRFAASPYADLSSTSWGALLVARLESALDPNGSGGTSLPALTATLQRAAVAVEAVPGAPRPDIRLAVSTGEDSAPMLAVVRNFVTSGNGGTRHADRPADGAEAAEASAEDAWFGESGSMTHAGRVFAFSNGGAFGPTAPVRTARFPEDCFELSLERDRIAQALGAPTGFHGRGDPASVSVALRVDPIGMREHWEIPVPAARLDAWRSLKLAPARREVLDRLPPTTLMAFTFHGDQGAAVSALMASGIIDDPMALVALDLVMARAGVPPLLEVLAGLQGDAVVYIEDGAPAPWFTIATGMDEDVARNILPILAVGVGMAPEGDDGALGGFLGMAAFQASYHDGELILTTNPTGIDGYLARKGGFMELPEAKAALAEIAPGAGFIGISRSGPAVAAIGRLLMRPVAHLGIPQLATLPNDLAKRGRHGFIAMRGSDQGVIVDAGGIVGGPLCGFSLIGGAVYASYVAGIKRMQRQLQELQRHHDATESKTEKSM